MAANALSSDTIAGLGVSSSPTAGLKTPYEAIAVFCHAAMLAVGFRLIGFGEDEKLDSAIDGSSPSPLPSQAIQGSSFSFRYAHAQSSLEFIVKVSRLGHKAVVFGIALGDDKTTSFDIVVKDYLSESAFPLSAGEDGLTAQQFTDAFISASRIEDLAKLFRISIIQKLAPGIAKEGYTEEADDTARNTTGPSNVPSRRRDPLAEDPLPQPARPRPFDDPLAYEPRRPFPAGDLPPPGFEDEYEINRPPRGGLPGFNPRGIGADDLNPPGLGLHDPLRIGGPRGPGADPHRGMHPTFDDPMFGGGMGGAGRGRDSRAPPGARYDPVGPDDDTPMGNLGFPGGPRGGPPNPFSGYGSGDFI